MRWNLPCAGCGLTVQVGQGQIGRTLRCPSCLARVTVTLPARQVEPPPPVATSEGRGRLWLVGAVSAVLLAGVAISVAYAAWSRSRPDPEPFGARRAGGSDRFGLMPGPRRASLLGPGPEAEPAPKPTIGEPTRTASTRLPVDDQPGLPALAAVGKVPMHLAVTLDPVTGLALLATRDGRLRVFDPAGWHEVRSRLLERPAYHLQIDPARRLLFAASSPAGALRLNGLGERLDAGGDIYVYDLDAALDSSGGQLDPARRFPIDAHLASLVLSPDGRQLYYLAEDAAACRLGRIDTAAWKADAPLTLQSPRPALLAMAPGGQALYALAGGRLFTVDAGPWAITDEVTTSFTVHAMVADDRGLVYLAERVRGVQLKVIDLATRKTLVRFFAETDGLPTLALAGGSGRLIVGTSAFASGRVWAVDVRGPIDQAPLIGQASSERGRLLRGSLTVTSDGRHLLTSTGHVFRLPS